MNVQTVYELQGVPKFVKQKSAVITSELEVTIWSGTFQKSRQVLKFLFKPPDGIPLVQSCLEIQPVIVESYSGAERVQCCLWFHESQTPTSVQRKFKTKYHKKSPQRITILEWWNRFLETGLASHRQPGQGRPYIADETIENVRQTFVRSPRKLTKRARLELNIRKTLEYERFWRNYCAASHSR